MVDKNRKAKVITALAVVAALGIGGTLAYLHQVTETATNVFASDKSINLELREPDWDGYEFGEEGFQYGAGVDEADKDNMDLGFNLAQRYTPGTDIPKDPQVKNTSKDEPIYTALKVQYFKVDGSTETQVTYEDFKTAYLKETEIVFNKDAWVKIDDGTGMDQIYMYGSGEGAAELAVNGITTPALFGEVPLSLDLEADEDGLLPKFNIKVTAYAIQATNVDAADAKDLLLNFINGQN